MSWSVTKNIGFLLLAIWLIITGTLYFVPLTSINFAPILAVLAIVAGVFIALGR